MCFCSLPESILLVYSLVSLPCHFSTKHARSGSWRRSTSLSCRICLTKSSTSCTSEPKLPRWGLTRDLAAHSQRVQHRLSVGLDASLLQIMGSNVSDRNSNGPCEPSIESGFQGVEYPAIRFHLPQEANDFVQSTRPPTLESTLCYI